MYDESAILTTARLYCETMSLTLSTVSSYAAGSGRALSRLAEGHTITTRRSMTIMRWLSDHWPSDVTWPEGVARPDSNAQDGKPNDDTASALERVREARARWTRAVDAGDLAAAAEAEMDGLRAATELDAGGRVCRRAAIEALGVPDHVFDRTVARFRDGRADGRPRPHSQPSRVLTLLRASGDVRFKEAS